MHSRSLIYQWLYTRWRKCLEFIAWLAISLFLYTGHVYISFISIFFISIFMIRPILPDIIKIAKNTYIIKFYNVVLWFVSYTISLKLISYQTGALEEHLKFSPAALAFPLSLILVFSIIIILCFLMLTLLQILSLSSIFITSNVKNKIIKSKFYFFCNAFILHYTHNLTRCFFNCLCIRSIFQNSFACRFYFCVRLRREEKR